MIDELIRKLQTIPLSRFLNESAKANQDFAEDLQREQMNAGNDAQSVKITPAYTKAYKARKQRLGLPSDRVTLRLSGDFQGEIYLITEQAGKNAITYTFDSKDEVKKYLVKRYGKNIFGLDKKNDALFTQRVVEGVEERVLEWLG